MIRWYTKAKTLLRAQGMTYQDVGDLLNLTESAVGHYLNGRREPSLEQVQKIAALLGVSLSELCGEDAYFIVKDTEKVLIDRFRTMSPEDQAAFLRIIQSVDKP